MTNVLTHRDGNVVAITLSRPQRLNGITVELLTELRERLALEARMQGELADPPDFAEGVAAFMQKRTAMFTDQ